MMRAYPGAYLHSVAWTSRRYFDPVSDDEFVAPMRCFIRKVAKPWDAFEGSAWHRALLLLGLAGILAGAVRPASLPRERLLLVFVAGTILWVGAVAILFEYGENNRFRHQVTGLWWIAIAWTIRETARRIGTRRGAPSPRE
jgi:hypothetical protein